MENAKQPRVNLTLIACSKGGCSYLLRKLHDRIRIFYLDDIMRDLYMRKKTS